MDKNERYTVSATVSFEITGQDIDDIMSAALDGGITYWCGKAEVVEEYLGEYASEQISRGGSLILYNIEDGQSFELTLEKFLNGLQLWVENIRSFSLAFDGRLDMDEIDADVADAIVQYALFNEIVYG